HDAGKGIAVRKRESGKPEGGCCDRELLRMGSAAQETEVARYLQLEIAGCLRRIGHADTSFPIAHRARSAPPPHPPDASSREARPPRLATIRARCARGLVLRGYDVGESAREIPKADGPRR